MSWLNAIVDRFAENPVIFYVFLFGFGLGAVTEWTLEHVPFWWREWRDRRRRKAREKAEGPQAFEKRETPPRLPARPQPPARGAAVRGQRPAHPETAPIPLPDTSADQAPAGAQKASERAGGGRHARPRQRQGRFFARQRRERR